MTTLDLDGGVPLTDEQIDAGWEAILRPKIEKFIESVGEWEAELWEAELRQGVENHVKNIGGSVREEMEADLATLKERSKLLQQEKYGKRL